MSNLRSLLVLDDNELFRLASESGAKKKKSIGPL